jgi:D-alanyl-D-alanine carboxypeptidase
MRELPGARRHWLVGAALAGLVWTLTGCSDNDDESAPVSSDAALTRTLASMHGALERQLGNPVPSLSVFVETSTNAFFASAGAEALTPDTRFRFASNTKNFTAAAVMKMHQDGWLRYTDLVTAPIPGYQQPYLPDTPDWAVPNKDRITIRLLLQHSAGVFDVGNEPLTGSEQTYEERVLAAEPAHDFTPGEMVAQAARSQLSYFAPGEGYHYSNTGYSMLAEIVGRVYSERSGSPRSLGDYLRDHLTGPGAAVPLDVHFPERGDDQALPAPRACGRILSPNQPPLIICEANVSAKIGEGNGIGTMRELNRWVRSLHSGSNALAPATVALMHDDRSAHNPDYGLGTFEVPNLGFGHNGATLGNLSLMVYDPATQVSVVVYLPMWDLTEGDDSFVKTFRALECTGWRAREALGYPGRPAQAECAPE